MTQTNDTPGRVPSSHFANDWQQPQSTTESIQCHLLDQAGPIAGQLSGFRTAPVMTFGGPQLWLSANLSSEIGIPILTGPKSWLQIAFVFHCFWQYLGPEKMKPLFGPKISAQMGKHFQPNPGKLSTKWTENFQNVDQKDRPRGGGCPNPKRP